jgi:hypothetical protein
MEILNWLVEKLVISALILFSVTAYSLPDAPQPQTAVHSLYQPTYLTRYSITPGFLERPAIASIRRDIDVGPNFAVGVQVPRVHFWRHRLDVEYSTPSVCGFYPPGPRCK